MARSIDYRSTLAYPAERVFAAITDEEYLQARLREIGGPGSALLDHEAKLITAHLEEFAVRLINAIAGRPEVRLGHRE